MSNINQTDTPNILYYLEPLIEPLSNDNTIKNKELKLRILNEPLGIKRNYFATCCSCLCCIDLIKPLTFEERVIKLTIGFGRKYAQYDIPRDIYSLCIDYVGQNFNAGKWKTNREIREMQREILINNYYQVIDCTDVFDPDEVMYSKLCCFDTFGWLGGLCWYCIGIAFFFGKDIAGLVIVANNSCDKAINGDSKYVSFEVNNWIRIGCIAHLVYSCIYCGPCVWCWTDFEHYDRIDKSILLMPLVCCFACFFIPWMVIGFLLYSEMIGYGGSVDSDCKNVVLSWCIIQVFESVIAPFAYCLFQSYCTFHDD